MPSLHMRLLPAALLLLPLARPTAPTPVPVTLGHSLVSLDGPWQFHTGDDPHWADPGYDDSTWETVDLTPAAGAHDPDVGLAGYVPGWGARAHPAYSGYAWYRMRVSVTAPDGDTLAVVGPLEVDDAYQLFVNGRLVGGTGDFSGARPVPYNTRPRLYVLSSLPSVPNALVIAVRVWVSRGTMAGDPLAGGMRIAPALGGVGAASAHHSLEWLAKFRGYVVDAALALGFVMLAAMALVLVRFDPTDSAYRWLAAASVLYALRRANQAFFFWTPYESAPAFNLVTGVLLTPLVLGAWTMAWRAWFRLRRPAWMPAAIGALTLLYSVAQFVNRPIIQSVLRLCFVVAFALTIYEGVRQERGEGWLAVLAVSLLAVALFASELSLLHVPGIWFPYDTGVSRTQYALAAFIIVMFCVFLQRLLWFARPEAAPRLQSR